MTDEKPQGKWAAAITDAMARAEDPADVPAEAIRYLATEGAPVETREDAAGERIVVTRLWAFDQPGVNQFGQPEYIARGAASYENVAFMEAHNGTPDGEMLAYEEREDGAYGVFRVEDTDSGNNLYKRLKKKLYRHVSPGFVSLHSTQKMVNGVMSVVHDKIRLLEVSATWRPAYQAAQIVQVRQRADDMGASAEDTQDAQKPVIEPVAAAAPDFRSMIADAVAPLRDQLMAMSENQRSTFDLPEGSVKDGQSALHKWMPLAVRYLAGERIPATETRALAEVISGDNLGVVPESVRGELLGIIDKSRPFMDTTQQVPEPEGLKLIYPRIVTRPTVGVQAAEKDEITSTTSAVAPEDFDGTTVAGGADISIQLIRKSSPSFLNLFMDLLAEAYAQNTDARAVAALLAEAAVVEGDVAGFDPAAPAYGEAFTNAMAAGRKALMPDRIWLSTAAAAAWLDAGGATGSAGIVNAGGERDNSLRIDLLPVHVPGLDATAVDVLIGPSRGFAWAEAGTFELAADNPTQLGRDVALAGIVWFAPLYPAAFTSYALPAA